MFWKRKNQWYKENTRVYGVGVLTTALIQSHKDWVVGNFQFGYIYNIEDIRNPEYFIIRKKLGRLASIWLPIKPDIADPKNSVGTILRLITLSEREIEELFVQTLESWIEFMTPIVNSEYDERKKKCLGFSPADEISDIGYSACREDLTALDE